MSTQNDLSLDTKNWDSPEEWAVWKMWFSPDRLSDTTTERMRRFAKAVEADARKEGYEEGRKTKGGCQTTNGYCCACDYDVSVFEADKEFEVEKARKKERMRAEVETGLKCFGVTMKEMSRARKEGYEEGYKDGYNFDSRRNESVGAILKEESK